MAASSTDDFPTQLASLLGCPVKQIRITDEEPPRISAIDLATAITKKDANHAAQDVGYVKDRHPEVTQILGDFKFRGQGQKKTPVTDLRVYRRRCGLEITVKNGPECRKMAQNSR